MSVTDSDKLTPKNPIIYGGAPFSTEGIEEISSICEAFSIDAKIEKRRMIYKHGWGTSFSEVQTVIGTCYLHRNDIHGQPTIVQFDVLKGSSPAIVGLELEKYSN